MNTKQKGNIGIGAAIAYFSKIGWTVSTPLTDSQDYDIIVDDGDFLYKVQVKYVAAKAPSGNYTIPLRSISGTTKTEYKTVIDSYIDYLFVVDAEYNWYLFPISAVTNKSTLTITQELKDKFLVK